MRNLLRIVSTTQVTLINLEPARPNVWNVLRKRSILTFPPFHNIFQTICLTVLTRTGVRLSPVQTDTEKQFSQQKVDPVLVFQLTAFSVLLAWTSPQGWDCLWTAQLLAEGRTHFWIGLPGPHYCTQLHFHEGGGAVRVGGVLPVGCQPLLFSSNASSSADRRIWIRRRAQN